jgi:hypothetical protein
MYSQTKKLALCTLKEKISILHVLEFDIAAIFGTTLIRRLPMALRNVAIVLALILSGCTSTAPSNTSYAQSQQPAPNAVVGGYTNDVLDPGRGLIY